MKFLLALVVILPAILAISLFILAYNLNGIWSVCCIIAGIFLLIPLLIAGCMMLYNILERKKK